MLILVDNSITNIIREGINRASNNREGRVFKALEIEWDFRLNSNVKTSISFLVSYEGYNYKYSYV